MRLRQRLDHLAEKAKREQRGGPDRIVLQFIGMNREVLCEWVEWDRNRPPREWPDFPRDAEGRVIFPEIPEAEGQL